MAEGDKGNVLAALLLGVGVAGCARALPEEGSPAAALYRNRCGSCHQPVLPSAMKAAVWQMILPRMEDRMRGTGQPLRADERAAIEAYIRRNSG